MCMLVGGGCGWRYSRLGVFGVRIVDVHEQHDR